MNRKILKLAIPNIITNITVPLLGMVDLAIAGRLGSDLFIGAMAIGTAIFNFIYWNFGFLRMGTSGFTAQALGARNLSECINTLSRSLLVAFSIALLLICLQIPISHFATWIMQGSDEVESMALEYFFIRIWAAPATLSLYAFKGWYIGMQNSRVPMIIAIVMNIVNIIVSVFLAFNIGMGLHGIAWGTVTAQYSGLAIALIYYLMFYRRLNKYFSFGMTFSADALRRFFVVNRDIFLRTICLVAVFTFFTSASSSMGDTTLAINTVLLQLFTLFSYMMDGFAYAAEALVGKYVGAKNHTMTRTTVRYTMIWGFVLSLLFTLVYVVFWRHILEIFTTSESVVEGAKEYLLWVIAVPLVSFCAFLYDGLLVGATKTAIMRNAMYIATAAFFALYYSLVSFAGNNALWIAFLIYLFMRGVIQWLMSRDKLVEGVKIPF